jgi:hypothetical protein
MESQQKKYVRIKKKRKKCVRVNNIMECVVFQLRQRLNKILFL